MIENSLTSFVSALPWIAIVITFSSTTAAIFLLKKLAFKIGLLDIPGGRKTHARSTPVVGGLGIFIGLCIGLLCLPVSLHGYRSFILAAGLLVFIGVMDDLHEVSAPLRLCVQLLSLSIMVIGGGVSLTQLGPLWGGATVYLGFLAIPVTLLGAATLINAVNMLDGHDGLAGLISIISLLGLSFLAYSLNWQQGLLPMLLLLASTFAFLLFNWPLATSPARVFMGDAGSTLLGFCLAWFTIAFSAQHSTVAPAAMLWFVALPLLDLATVFIRRLLARRSPFSPGKEHIQNLLTQLGFSSKQVLLICGGLAALFCLVGLASVRYAWPDHLSFSAFLAVFVVYFSVSRYLGKRFAPFPPP